MDNEHMKTSEVELRMLIEESKSLIDKNQLMIAKGEATLSKMNKTLKGFVATAIPIVLAFFWTFYDNGRTMARIEESSLSKTEAADKYATKADVVFPADATKHSLSLLLLSQIVGLHRNPPIV